LEFNSHVHAIVTAGGFSSSSSSWQETVYYEQDALLDSWRKAVIKLLRAALHAGQLVSTSTADQIKSILSEQEKRWWSVKIQSFKSKDHFLRYAGRYVRRPPIAQKRVTFVGERIVRFWYKDKKLRRKVFVGCSPEEFIDRWSRHILERYSHAIRSFGLFAPRGMHQTFDAVFAILGQERRSLPKPRRWLESIKRDFNRDPLLDSKGKRMIWARRISPKASQ
jgi:hypothetical protein